MLERRAGGGGGARHIWRYPDSYYPWFEEIYPENPYFVGPIEIFQGQNFEPYVWTLHSIDADNVLGWVDYGNYPAVRTTPDNQRVQWAGEIYPDWGLWGYPLIHWPTEGEAAIREQAQMVFHPGAIPPEYRPEQRTTIIFNHEIAQTGSQSTSYQGYVDPDGSMYVTTPLLMDTLYSSGLRLTLVSYRIAVK